MNSADRKAPQDDELSRESERLVLRYIDEVVLTYNLCPWAHRSRREKKLRIKAICGDFLSSSATLERVKEVALELSRTPAHLELVLFPLPRYLGPRLAMDGLLRELRAASTMTSCENEFAFAAFHPAAELDARTPETMIPFFRRTPVPMIQAVRTSVLAAVSTHSTAGTAFVDPTEILAKLSEPAPVSLRAEIARANALTLEATGATTIATVFDELRKEALDSLRGFDVPPLDRSTWSNS